MGARFQKVEQAAYSGNRRPWWFILGLIVFAALYFAALAGFIVTPEKTWAGWVLMVVIPAGVALKGGLVTLNKKGQQAVTSIEGDAAWRKIALARGSSEAGVHACNPNTSPRGSIILLAILVY